MAYETFKMSENTPEPALLPQRDPSEKKTSPFGVTKSTHSTEYSQEDIPMYGQVIKPPYTIDIPCATIKSYLEAPTIETGQTRENNNTLKKMWQKKSLALLQSDTLRRQELQNSQSMQSTIDEQIFVTWLPNRRRLSIKRPRPVITSL
jgi:hypothetical protein